MVCNLITLTFHRLSNFKTALGNIGAYLSLPLCAANLRLHVPWLRCKRQKDCLSLRVLAEKILVP